VRLPAANGMQGSGRGGTTRSGIFYGWRIVGGTFLIYFVSGGLFNTATVFFKALSADLGLSRGELSGVFSIGFLVAGASTPFWGRIADRHGARAAFLPGVVLTGLLCILISRVTGLVSLYAVYLLFTFGTAGISLVPISVVISNWFREKRGRAMGISYMGEGFGALVLVPVAGLLLASVGWRNAYVLSGLAVLLLLTPVAVWIKNRPADLGLAPDGRDPSPPDSGDSAAAPAAAAGETGFSRAEAVRTSTFRMVAVTWFVAMTPLMAVVLHQVPFLTDLGFSIEAASLAAGAIGGAGILGRLGFGLLSERYPICPIYAACYAMMGAGIASLWATQSLGIPGLLLYVTFFGIAVGGAFALAGLLAVDLFGLRAFGEIFGLLGLVATAGGAIGVTGAGLLFDAAGSYDSVFATCIALCAVATALMLLVRRPDADGAARRASQP